MKARPLQVLAVVALAFVMVAHGSTAPGEAPVKVASATAAKPAPPEVTPAPAAQTPASGDPSDPADPTSVLPISAVSPWVEADGEFQIRFGPTTRVPPDAQLTYTIHQSLSSTSRTSLRSKVLEIIDGGSTGKVLQAPVTRKLADYGNPADGAVVSIPIRSGRSADSTRAFLPNSGIHPVDLVLTSGDGPELWSQVVFLNRLPRPQTDDTNRPVTVSMILPIEAGPAFTPTAEPEFSLDSRFQLDSTTELLTKVGAAPLRLGLRPDTFAGLTRVDQTWSQNLIAAIGKATGAEPKSEPGGASGDDSGDGQAGSGATTTSTSAPTTTSTTTTAPGSSGDAGGTNPSGRPGEGDHASLLALPFVNVDTGGLADPRVRSDAGQVLSHQLSLGDQVVAEVSNSAPKSSTWALDDSVTNESLSLIKAAKFTDVAVPASRIELTEDLDAEQVVTGPVQLDGAPGMRAIAYDEVLSQQLTNPSLSPAVRAHDALALLMSSWFSANRSRSDATVPTSVILLPPTIDAEVVKALTSAFSGSGPLRVATGPSLIPEPTDGVDEPVTRLTPVPAQDISGTVAESIESGRQIDAVDSMSQSAEPDLGSWRILDAETFAKGMSAADRQARHNTIRAGVALKFGAIETPPPRKVLLAARRTTIPLRFRNNLPYQVRLRMEARSPRLDVRSKSDGLIVLEPGGNRIDLPVSVQAPGESLLRARLSTPDGSMDLASFDIPVSSRSISGVGSALSIVSILFLLLWWIHTLRKRRREAGRAQSQHPAAVGTPGGDVSDTVPPDAGTVDQSG